MPVTEIALVTRFSLRDRRFMSMAGIFGERSRAAWLERRIDLFREFTLPSVRSQEKRPLRWYLLLSEGDQRFLERADLGLDDWIEPVFVPDGQDYSDLLQQKFVRDFGHLSRVVFTRVDNDDAISRTFLSQIAERDADGGFSGDHAYVFKKGARWDGERLQLVEQDNNAFCSIASSEWKTRPIMILKIVHLDVPRLFPHTIISTSEPMWMQTIHGRNVLNHWTPGEGEIMVDRERPGSLFAIGKAARAALQSNSLRDGLLTRILRRRARDRFRAKRRAATGRP
jgi:hypothetical protein